MKYRLLLAALAVSALSNQLMAASAPVRSATCTVEDHSFESSLTSSTSTIQVDAGSTVQVGLSNGDSVKIAASIVQADEENTFSHGAPARTVAALQIQADEVDPNGEAIAGEGGKYVFGSSLIITMGNQFPRYEISCTVAGQN